MTDNNTTTAKPSARRAKSSAASAPAPVATASAGATKSDSVIKLLLRAKGATAMELIAATDWQPHSVRAFLSGLRKKGRVLAREPRKSGPAAYRITAVGDAGGANAPSDPAVAPAASALDGVA